MLLASGSGWQRRQDWTPRPLPKKGIDGCRFAGPTDGCRWGCGSRQALGYFHAQGFLISRNSEKSCAEYKAAASSHAAAAWQWSQCQIAVDPTAAWRQIELAGGMGHAIAQEWLGRCCLGEFGAETKDFPCARDWLGRSASQGRPKSQTLLAYLFNSGQGGAVRRSKGAATLQAGRRAGRCGTRKIISVKSMKPDEA